MQIRILIGELEEHPANLDVPAPEAEITIISYPMTQDYQGDDPDHPQKIRIENDRDLKKWAENRYGKWEITTLKLPSGAIMPIESQAEIRQREIAEALIQLSTAYDDPKGHVRNVLEEARDVIHAAWKEEECPVDHFDVAHGHLTELIEASRSHS